MRLEDMILISVDDHVVEPPSLGDFFRENLPTKFKDRAPRVIRRDDGTDAWLIEGQEISTFGLNAVQGRPPERWGNDPKSFDQVRPGTYDIHARVRDMDVNGVLGSLNFPSWPGLGGQFFVQNKDTEYVEAIVRTYNDWHIHEWCGAYPGRFIPLGLSGFPLGAEWMAGEIRRLAEQGCYAVSCHPEAYRFGSSDYHGDEWDAAWQAAERRRKLSELTRRQGAGGGLSPAATPGFVCPVKGQVGFINDWGFPRSGGRTHKGTDMFARKGTPLVAVGNGSVRLYTNNLGGTVARVNTDYGFSFYYAHMDGYAPGIRTGQRVSVGQTIGYVGNTGNAIGTSPHLHFQIHPGGGAPVNPYPTVRYFCG